MTIATEILKTDSITEIKEHAKALAARKADLAAQLSGRRNNLVALKAKLTEHRLGDDFRAVEAQAWIDWIDAAATALGGLPATPSTLP